jgi:hypothetical protein
MINGVRELMVMGLVGGLGRKQKAERQPNINDKSLSYEM